MKLIGTQVAVEIIKIKRERSPASLGEYARRRACLVFPLTRCVPRRGQAADEFARAYENEEWDSSEKVVRFIDNIKQDVMPVSLSQMTAQEIRREIRDAILLHQIAFKK